MTNILRAVSGTRLTVVLLALTAVLALPHPASAQEAVEYYATDAIGSVRVVFDAAGNVLGRMDYAPFGEELYTGLFLPGERFAQLMRDGEAGQDYAQARMYQVRTGRFGATDPIYAGLLHPQNWNRYTYTFNNPLRFVDPSGLTPDLRFWTATDVIGRYPREGLRGVGGGDDTIIGIIEDEPDFGQSGTSANPNPDDNPGNPDNPGGDIESGDNERDRSPQEQCYERWKFSSVVGAVAPGTGPDGRSSYRNPESGLVDRGHPCDDRKGLKRSAIGCHKYVGEWHKSGDQELGAKAGSKVLRTGSSGWRDCLCGVGHSGSLYFSVQHHHNSAMSDRHFGMKAFEDRCAVIKSRFPDRHSLPKDELYSRFFSDLPKDIVMDCFEAIEQDYHIQVGFLRPDDSLAALFAPVTTWNPVRWMLFRSIESDGLSELQAKLAKRKGSASRSSDRIRTFGELVRNWAKPPTKDA